MQITLTGVMVQDQDHALDFYTSMLGFVKKTDIPMGQFRWLTVSSPGSKPRRKRLSRLPQCL
jgi:hypothetical protein